MTRSKVTPLVAASLRSFDVDKLKTDEVPHDQSMLQETGGLSYSTIFYGVAGILTGTVSRGFLQAEVLLLSVVTEID